MTSKRMGHFFSPARILLLSLMGTIIISMFILWLPVCRKTSISLVDLLFISTSAICGTGLSPISLHDFTTIGHIALLIMMQIGGLGIITLTIFLVSLFLQLNFSTQLIFGQLLDLDSWKHIKRIIFFIIGSTLIAECISTICIFLTIHHEYSLKTALFLSIFHAVSGFCHAGFSLFPDSFVTYQNSPMMLLPMIVLIFASSIGFLVWYEILRILYAWQLSKRHLVSLHTKLVLLISLVLVGVSTLLFFAVEYNHSLRGFTFFMKIINALFNVVCARGTGFITIDLAELEYATLLLFMVLAFIGSSPGSPGSGIKTTTITVLYSTIKSAIVGQSSVFLYRRKIPMDQVYRALAIAALSISWIVIALFLLLLTDSGKSFIAILFELISAFGTVGLSLGITEKLSILGKCIIMITMVLGRIGSLAFFLALCKIPKKSDFTYPEERIMLG
jgi:trk system potassium uptake protein TrkH